ncbi:MAG: Deoxyribodipyrimidine photolyase [uncultured Thermomicrobiales bacterium]|uniref:Deoxyribodipyrimidine photo-lyase n=1 Tax=uncultured Thermomicrobiales bacterium TaxID=1645740 RepID=A0A6J4VET4_9BACT|nr:MAG: Deoxyribodipyrimidine photolyase [uncultured Thermomicrobiales bacterium]
MAGGDAQHDDGRGTGPIVIWFRRDLRLHDHPALTAALAAGRLVAPLFVFDEALLRGRWPAPNRVWFMRESVRALGEGLRERGGGLAIRVGQPEVVVAEFAAEVGASTVYVTRDYAPYARGRDRRVAAALAGRGIGFAAKRGLLVHEPEGIVSAEGQGYTVFSPYRRCWELRRPRAVLPAPGTIPTPPRLRVGTPPALDALGPTAPTAREIPEPGEAAARSRLDAWVADGLADYDEARDQLADDGTSRLSQDLHWGLLSPVEVLARAGGGGAGRATFRSELCWRDFYTQILFHHPRVTREPFNAAYARLDWRNDPDHLTAWREGRTGYPIVDAAMRQMVTLGWMHNRARMITASFLTKHLLTHYAVGEEHFMAHLTDGDLAANNGGWQWAASVGTDAQPYFRIFNPTLQGQRHDPAGDYVRRWLPELARVPTRYIHEPWTMPEEVQREVGCVIGADYPAPIVEHAEARRLALDVFKRAADVGRE